MLPGLLSHYRPGQAWGFQQVEAPRISRQSADEGVSPLHRPPLTLGHNPVSIPVRGWVEPRAIVLPERLSQWKIPMTQLGNEPATFRLKSQCLSQLRHRVPPTCFNMTEIKISTIIILNTTCDVLSVRYGTNLYILFGLGLGLDLSHNRPSRWPKGVRVG